MPENRLADLVAFALREIGGDFGAWLRAWARVLPSLILVPAFAGAALPAAVRTGLAVGLGVAIAPALRPVSGGSGPLAPELLHQAWLGLPVAIGAAALFYAALMAGGLIDDLRGARESSALPVFQGGASPLGALLGLLVAILFLESGGAPRLVAGIAASEASGGALAAAAAAVTASIGLAVAAAAPVAAVAVVAAVAEALVARAAMPAHVTALLAPVRGVALLAVAALVLDRMLELFASRLP